jgi:hypothetical protein
MKVQSGSSPGARWAVRAESVNLNIRRPYTVRRLEDHGVIERAPRMIRHLAILSPRDSTCDQQFRSDLKRVSAHSKGERRGLSLGNAPEAQHLVG